MLYGLIEANTGSGSNCSFQGTIREPAGKDTGVPVQSLVRNAENSLSKTGFDRFARVSGERADIVIDKAARNLQQLEYGRSTCILSVSTPYS